LIFNTDLQSAVYDRCGTLELPYFGAMVTPRRAGHFGPRGRKAETETAVFHLNVIGMT
jgi:hypothetical protein